MPDFDRETTRTAKTFRLESDGPPRVEANVVSDSTSASLRLTINGVTRATEADAVTELLRVLAVVRNRIRELYGLA